MPGRDLLIRWGSWAFQGILMFGSGEAKGELKKRLERNDLDGLIVGIETADKMTDRQIAAKVRQHFPGSARQ